MTLMNPLAAKAREDSGGGRKLAETIARLVSDAARTPPIEELATKADIATLRAEMATKHELRTAVAELRADLSDKLRSQGFLLLGSMTGLIAAAVAILKLT